MQNPIIRRQSKVSPSLAALPPLLQRLYSARNISSVAELDRNLATLLPFQLLKGIDAAVAILVTALIEQKRILVVGDFDADGATSTAVAVRALKSFGAKRVNYLVPNRFAYGYGLTPELVKAATVFAPELIVTVDNGIANHAGVDAAKANGIQVLITDHHLPAATTPAADAIVNPNQLGDTFPSKNLAGVGVIFYVMLALRRRLLELNWFQKNALPEPNMSRLLDLVALGTVADLVQLDQNNRILVHQGLRRIRAGQCVPGIVALLELAKRDFTRCLAADLGFAVAARLNAAGRMDDMSLGIECLLSDDATDARVKAQRLDTLNQERRQVESTMQTQALSALEKINTEASVLPLGVCLYDENWHQGVIGILASRIKEKYHRPVIVFAPGQDNEIKGSARSIEGLHIRDVLAQLDAMQPGLIHKFGGHAMAAGLTIAKTDFKQFAALFDELVGKVVNRDQLERALYSDGALSDAELSQEVASMLRNEGPWGQAFPEPLFDDQFTILEQRLVGDKHLKLKLGKGEKVIDAIAFFVNPDVWPNHRCTSLHAAYRLDINEYKGRANLQLIIDYLEPA